MAYTYTTLKAAIVAFTEDQGTEFDTNVDKIIPLAEERILRDLDLELFDKAMSGVFQPSNEWLTKPTDLVALRSLHYTNAAGDFVLIEPRSWTFCKDYWPKAATTTATPKFFAEHDENTWLIAGTPASALALTIRFTYRPTGLTSTNATTWLGTNAGDLLFFACLVASEQFLKADNRVPVWKAEYIERLAAAKVELKAEARINYKI